MQTFDVSMDFLILLGSHFVVSPINLLIDACVSRSSLPWFLQFHIMEMQAFDVFMDFLILLCSHFVVSPINLLIDACASCSSFIWIC